MRVVAGGGPVQEYFGIRGPSCQLRERQRGALRDVAAGPHEAARTSPAREVTVHGEAVMQTIKRVWMGEIRKPHRLHFAIEREISLDVII